MITRIKIIFLGSTLFFCNSLFSGFDLQLRDGSRVPVFQSFIENSLVLKKVLRTENNPIIKVESQFLTPLVFGYLMNLNNHSQKAIEDMKKFDQKTLGHITCAAADLDFFILICWSERLRKSL